MEIPNGNVVVIREDDAIVAVYYREHYEEIGDFFDEVNGYIFSYKKLANPSVSYMKIEDNRFKVLGEDEEFYKEFEFFSNLFQVKEWRCPICKTLHFINVRNNGVYCPTCKK